MPRSLGRRLAFVLVALVAACWTPVAGLTVAQPWHVEGRSMEPSIHDGSMLLVDAIGPRVGGYARGDVVIVPVPPSVHYPSPVLVKRIVAVAGDHVLIEHGVVKVNGRPEDRAHLAPGTLTPVAGRRLDVVVPPGAVFVMGDHRENSFDSKAFGPVPAQSLLGRAWVAIAPGGHVELPGAAAGAP